MNKYDMTLEKFILTEKYDIQNIQYICKQIFNCIEYLHSLKII
jgi:serine/threonine protein kinase